jgi:mannose-6-phosphate isomerase-like protein (cupin superfamily)
MLPTLIVPGDLAMHRISPGDTVRLGVLAGPEVSPVTMLLEAWDVGGAQPPNSHPISTELFFFLRGRGLATCDGTWTEVGAGATLVLPPGSLHHITNTGPSRLYAITMMSPDDGFAELVRRGPLAVTDSEDRAVLTGPEGLTRLAGVAGQPGPEPSRVTQPGPDSLRASQPGPVRAGPLGPVRDAVRDA